MRIVALALFILAGCESVYNAKMPPGMTLIEHHYTSWTAISEFCDGGEACAIVTGDVCTIHLPLAMNGEPMYRAHEIRHCSGQLDAPKPIKRYFPPTIADRAPGP